MRRLTLPVAMWLAALVAIAAAALGAGVRSTEGGQAAVDEPQYLLTALSLWEDRSLDISDELAAQRWRDYHDAALPVQTKPLAGGRQVSPHDPLLPLLLAAPVGLAGAHGWLAARLTLALLAGLVAALTVWVGVRRLGLTPALAGAGVAALAASPPLAVYGQQVYPELPAAGLVLGVVALGTGRLSRPGLAGVVAAVTALPWLSVKYAPVAAVLALLVLWRLVGDRRRGDALAVTGALALSGLAYLGLHRLWWGGFTPYATGDHFATTGEFSVMGVEPDFAGRTLRLVGLLADRGYGIAAWAPVWLLTVVAVAALLRARRAGAVPAGWLLAPLAAGYAVATWVAYTMHGFWWPGRQLVVVLPLAGLAGLWWLGSQGVRPRILAALLAGAGILATAFLTVGGYAGQVTWASDFQQVGDPLYQAGRLLLPDYTVMGTGDWVRHFGWIVVLAALARHGWRSARPAPRQPDQPDQPDHPDPTTTPDLLAAR